MRARVRPIKLLFGLGVAMLLAACGARATPVEPPTTPAAGAVVASDSRLLDQGSGIPAAGELAPDFSYLLADGSSVRLSDLRGTPVVLNFWATWCVPCVEEMPQLQQAADDANGKLVVLGVNRNEAPAAIARFTHEVAVSFPLIPNIPGDIADRYGVTGLPITYFIHSDGTIAARQFGALTPAVLAQQLETLR